MSGIRKNSFIDSVVKHWKRLTREVVESQSLEVLKKGRHDTLQDDFVGMVVFSQRLNLIILEVVFSLEDPKITRD